MVRYLINARLVTLAGDPGPRRGEAMRDLGIIDRGWICIEDDRIVDLGSGDPPPEIEGTILDLGGRVVIPGWVDCHTHACWAGSRLDECEAGLAGVPYLELLQRGGGIM